MLYAFAGFGVIKAILLGGLLGAVLGLLLIMTVCRTQTAADDLAADDKPTTPDAAEETNAAHVSASQGGTSSTVDASASTTATADATSSAASTTAAADATTSAAASTAPSVGFTIQPSKPLKGQEELAARKGEWKYKAPVNDTVKTAPAAKVKPTAKPAASKAAPKAKPAAKAKAAKAGDDAAPAILLSAARPEGPDDLKRISGVGPKAEQTLNNLGIYHFDQIAKFKKKDIAWVDARLRFKGRIERDDWMSQAKILAKGGETEFSKKKKS
ncbi:hypothetical protein ABMC88_11475 [Sulfitobacter sp. HNIBRBA2951]|uniref:hypothetical protein n=1 Tax=Sulfitobacter aquimarinus TaxID=3158557 RepID=UPI0032DEDF3C